MKYSILLMLIMLPCLAIFNESESFIPNIIGVMYSIGLYFFLKETKYGRKFSKNLDDELNKL